MNDKLKLLEHAAKYAEKDKEFMAYYLQRFSEVENMSLEKVATSLNCSNEGYFKLGLCRAPDPNENLIDGLNEIADYIHVSTLELVKIVRRVNVMDKLTARENSDSLLMAARDKDAPED